jgi:hypothetical protein
MEIVIFTNLLFIVLKLQFISNKNQITLNFFIILRSNQETIMKKYNIIIAFLIVIFTSCSDSTTTSDTMYFPTNGTSAWETKTISSLGWNQNAVQPLLDYLALKNSKSFILLVNGKIVMEKQVIIYLNHNTNLKEALFQQHQMIC